MGYSWSLVLIALLSLAVTAVFGHQVGSPESENVSYWNSTASPTPTATLSPSANVSVSISPSTSGSVSISPTVSPSGTRTPTRTPSPSSSPPVNLNTTFGDYSPVSNNSTLQVSTLCAGIVEQDRWISFESVCSYKAMVNITRCDLKQRPKHVSLSLSGNFSSSSSIHEMYNSVGYSSMLWLDEFIFNVTLTFTPWSLCDPFDFPNQMAYNLTLQWTVYPEETGDFPSPYWTQWNPGSTATALPSYYPLFSLEDCTVLIPFTVPNFLHPFTDFSPGVGFHVDCTLVGADSNLGIGVNALRHVSNDTGLPRSYDMLISVSPWVCPTQNIEEILGIVSKWNLTCVFLLSDYTKDNATNAGNHTQEVYINSGPKAISYLLNEEVQSGNSSDGLIWSSSSDCLGSVLLPQPFSSECLAHFAVTVPENCINPPNTTMSVHVTSTLVIFGNDAISLPATSALLTGVGTYALTSSFGNLTMDTLNFYYQLAPWLQCDDYFYTIGSYGEPPIWTLSFSTVLVYEDDDDGQELGFPVQFWGIFGGVLGGILLSLIFLFARLVLIYLPDLTKKWSGLLLGLKDPIELKKVREAEMSYLNKPGKDQPDFAVCLSGGGIRSACFSLGVLEQLGDLLEKIDIISCVSGGGYAGTAYMQRLVTSENPPDRVELIRDIQKKVKENPGYLFRKKTLLAFSILYGLLFSILILILFAFPISSLMMDWCHCEATNVACYGWSTGSIDDDDGNYIYDDGDSVSHSFASLFLTFYLCPNYNAANPGWFTLFSASWSILLIIAPLAFIGFSLFQLFSKCTECCRCPNCCSTKKKVKGINECSWKLVGWTVVQFVLLSVASVFLVIFIWETICAMTFLYTIVFRDAYTSLVYTSLVTIGTLILQFGRVILPAKKIFLVIVGILMLFLFPLFYLSIISAITYLSLTYMSTSGFFGASCVNIGLSLVLILYPEPFSEAMHDYYRKTLLSVFFKEDKDFDFDRATFRQGFPLYLSNCTLEKVHTSTRNATPSTFTFSQLHYGSRITGFYPTKKAANKAPPTEQSPLMDSSRENEKSKEDSESGRWLTPFIQSQRLSISMAISGAALASRLGEKDSGNISALVGFIGLNMGKWIPHCRLGLERLWGAIVRILFIATFLSFSITLLYTTSGWIGFAVAGISMFVSSALFGLEYTSYCPLLRLIRHSSPFSMNALTSPYLFLTDGGHYENLGLKEALKRRPKLIFAVDAGEDRGRNLSELDSSLQKTKTELKEDENIEFEFTINTSPRELSCKVERGIEGSETVSVWIQYSMSGPEITGVLTGDIFYVKATLTDLNDRNIHLYAMGHPDFPHDPTANQNLPARTEDAYMELGRDTMQRVLAGEDCSPLVRALRLRPRRQDVDGADAGADAAVDIGVDVGIQ